MIRGFLFILLAVSAASAHKCANPLYECPDEATCCLLEDGEFGCCPLPAAVCCDDHIHCCPEGSVCNVEEGTCNGANGERLHWVRKQKARQPRWMLEDVICPGERERCPPETTCCLMATGNYGCCPSPHAVCCADHLHCCPDGFRCDSSGERCYQAETNRMVPWLTKFVSTSNVKKDAVSYRNPVPVRNALDRVKNPVECGSAAWGCPLHSTCCTERDRRRVSFTCCPLSQGVCCAGSCCPHGYSCSEGDKCARRALSSDAFFDFFLL